MQTLRVLNEGKAGMAYSTLNDVARVANQATGAVAIMAVVGAGGVFLRAGAFSFVRRDKLSRANCALAVLRDQKSVEDFSRHPRPGFANLIVMSPKKIWVPFDLLPAILAVGSAFLGLSFLTASPDLRAHVISSALLLNVWAAVVLAVALQACLTVVLVSRAPGLQNPLPFLRRAIVFAFTHVTLPASVSRHSSGQGEQL